MFSLTKKRKTLNFAQIFRKPPSGFFPSRFTICVQASMALQVSGTGFGLFHRRSGLRIRARASESVTTSRAEEEKVKLGGSDVKVTKLGIGAWAWGDTSYWNDSQWDGN